jgi:hypothetical protein
MLRLRLLALIGLVSLSLVLTASARCQGHGQGGHRSGAGSGARHAGGHAHARGRRPGVTLHPGHHRGRRRADARPHPNRPKRVPHPKTTAGGKNAGKKLSPKQRKAVQNFINNNQNNLSGPQKQALNNVLSGNQLSAADRQAVSDLLVNDRGGLSPDAREALTQALNDDTEARMHSFVERFLRVHNDTGEPLRVWVQYHTLTDRKSWVWYPSNPGHSHRAVSFTLKPGAVLTLEDEQRPIRASRVRIWARSTSGKEWLGCRDDDLWLVPEAGHRYEAVAMETYPVTFEQPDSPRAEE